MPLYKKIHAQQDPEPEATGNFSHIFHSSESPLYFFLHKFEEAFPFHDTTPFECLSRYSPREKEHFKPRTNNASSMLNRASHTASSE